SSEKERKIAGEPAPFVAAFLMPVAKSLTFNKAAFWTDETSAVRCTLLAQKFALTPAAARSQSSTRRHLHCSREFGPDGGEWIARRSPVPVRYRQSRARGIDPAGKMLEKYFPAR